MVIVVIKVSCYCGVITVFDVKYMTLESIYDSIFCLPYTFSGAPVANLAIYQIIALASTFSDCTVGFMIV